MDYKESYELTLQQLYFATREIAERDRREEKNLIVLGYLEAIIISFDSSLDRLQGERKTSAINTLKKLYFVFNHLGRIYLDELSARKKLFKAQSEILELSRTIEELQSQLKVERELNNF